MTFGTRVRELRKAEGLSQRALAGRVGMDFTYLSKIESGGVDPALYPSEALIRRLADVLGAEVDELMLLAKKIPAGIRERVLQRPDAFRALASLDDDSLDRLLRQVRRA